MHPYNVHTGIDGLTDKPRAADQREVDAYLEWLADRRGIMVPASAHYSVSGIWDGKECILEMPGYGADTTVTLEELDEAGEVVRTSRIGTNAKGQIGLAADAVRKACALPKVTKPRKARAAAPVVEAVAADPAPVAAIPDDVAALVASLVARIEALETSRGYSAPPAPANDAVTPVRRSERQAAAIRRAWAMRRAMRERADLDARALVAANGAYRSLLDQYATRTAEADQARAQLAAAEARADAAERRVSVQDRDAAALRAQLRTVEARAERLVTIATGKRRAAASDRAALDRVRADLAGAQAETRAVQRRFATLRDALAASPVAAAVVAKRTPAVLEA